MTLASIQQLLAPIGWDEFVREHHGRHHLHIPGAPAKVDGLVSWSALNAALEQHRLAHPRLLVAKGGQNVEVVHTRLDPRRQRVPHLDVGELYRRLRDGYTLLIYEIEELFPPVRLLSDALGRHFGPGCQANLFASWGERGNGIHYDDHEVFVVQLSGRKRWRMFGPTRRFPLARDAGLGLAGQPPAEFVDERVLAPGDVLYLPRGHWHEVDGVGEPSLHLSMGIDCPTGLTLFEWLSRELAGEPLLAQELPRFADPAAQARHMARLRERLLAALDDSVVERFFRSAEASVRARPRLSLPHAAVGDGLPAGDDFVVTSTLPAAPELRREGDEVVLRALGRTARFAGEHERLLERLLEPRPWTFRELPGGEQARAVIAELLLLGMVFVTA